MHKYVYNGVPCEEYLRKKDDVLNEPDLLIKANSKLFLLAYSAFNLKVNFLYLVT